MAVKTQKLLKSWENYYPAIISVFITLVFFTLCPDEIIKKVYTKEIINAIITISGILFGFLLTILALLLQSDNKSLRLIKIYGRFGELVLFNKRAVYSAAFALIISLVLLIIIDLNDSKIYWIINFMKILKYVWFYSFIATLLKTYRYIDIFYNLIKE